MGLAKIGRARAKAGKRARVRNTCKYYICMYIQSSKERKQQQNLKDQHKKLRMFSIRRRYRYLFFKRLPYQFFLQIGHMGFQIHSFILHFSLK